MEEKNKLEILVLTENVEKYEKEHGKNTLEIAIDKIVNDTIKISDKFSDVYLADYGYDENGELDKRYALTIEYLSEIITTKQTEYITNKIKEIVDCKSSLWEIMF